MKDVVPRYVAAAWSGNVHLWIPAVSHVGRESVIDCLPIYFLCDSNLSGSHPQEQRLERRPEMQLDNRNTSQRIYRIPRATTLLLVFTHSKER